MWKAVAAAAILDLVQACVRAVPEPSVPAMPSLSYMRPEEFHSSVLIFWRDLLAEVVAQTAILFFPGQKVGRIELVSHLFQQLDRAEINDFLWFLTAVFSIVSAICGFPLVFKHQHVCTGTAESGEIERRREGNGELSPTDEMCLYLVQFHSQGCGISIQVWCVHLFCQFGARLGLVGPFGELYLCISFTSLFSRLLRPALVRDQDAANYPLPPQTPQTSLSTVKIVNKCDLFHYAR